MYFVRDGALRSRPCACAARRRSLKRIRESGLGDLYERCTFETFRTDRPWQEYLKRKAEAYVKGQSGWFFVTGRSGSGKTHLTAAIAHALLDAGLETCYFMWRRDGRRLKAMANDMGYDAELRRFTDCRVLVIDDLFKGGAVTDADLSLAFELLNDRYNRADALTVISSELEIKDILLLDEAVCGRITQRARGFLLQTGDEDLRLIS